MMKLVILDDYERTTDRISFEQLSLANVNVEIFYDQAEGDELVNRIRNAEIIIPIRERTHFTRELFLQLPNLMLIAQTGSGTAHIDKGAAEEQEIEILTTPGGSQAVTELVFGLMIAHARQILQLNQETKQNKWSNAMGTGLAGKTLGVVGLGKIGARVAGIAKVFGMRVIAWGPRLTEERAFLHDVEYVELEQLFSQSDFLSVHVRLVPETKNLIKAEHFKMMKRSAFFMNTSRGEIVDEEALVQALEEKQIAGAGIDVFTQEPLKAKHPLTELDNVILTPHIGWKTDSTFEMFLNKALDNVTTFLKDKAKTIN
ncbi:D-isomer specific 2-hydroxyacid dehydrogenase, NAD-binding protein [Alkalihalophilus pseudofirmus OF4]|uniref:D-isomer specific 2-hydroxyacid dehydrogenase, NAD-binding protein n=1 Tax=Alkalihalophilus pseudofirmus (strain ATCC BAA-2126 / JCM 17055 / OF4) TaxID=398511 RepID=D3FYX7_ALKPO|nr:D-2-hydroxyacid dehydrogenase family protein [Alkalihalophilus pseudofirmus]ADC49010.1 D-isomer specific 2-hydroxyacid dehydrogenase, NAD-binding protein [Alkalihalophilus pseudofirmus OF4]